MAKELLDHPVELLDGVVETLDALAGRVRLVLITKGDLYHQWCKIEASGLGPPLRDDRGGAREGPATYRRILDGARGRPGSVPDGRQLRPGPTSCRSSSWAPAPSRFPTRSRGPTSTTRATPTGRCWRRFATSSPTPRSCRRPPPPPSSSSRAPIAEHRHPVGALVLGQDQAAPPPGSPPVPQQGDRLHLGMVGAQPPIDRHRLVDRHRAHAVDEQPAGRPTGSPRPGCVAGARPGAGHRPRRCATGHQVVDRAHPDPSRARRPGPGRTRRAGAVLHRRRLARPWCDPVPTGRHSRRGAAPGPPHDRPQPRRTRWRPGRSPCHPARRKIGHGLPGPASTSATTHSEAASCT